MIQTLVLEGYLPLSVDRLPLRNAHKVRAGHVKRDAQRIGLEAKIQGIMSATGKRQVTVRFEQPKGRLADPQNRMKILEDALVQAHLLIDDSSEWYAGASQSVRGPKRRTVVVLEDVEV